MCFFLFRFKCNSLKVSGYDNIAGRMCENDEGVSFAVQDRWTLATCCGALLKESGEATERESMNGLGRNERTKKNMEIEESITKITRGLSIQKENKEEEVGTSREER